MTISPEEFLSRVDKTDTCWLWIGSPTRGGYGSVHVQGRNYMAHRISYSLFKGEIPIGLVIDHLCRNRKCVNPDHLEPVTSRENTLRGIGIAAMNTKKTHCNYGHKFTPENTYYLRGRRCQECNRIRTRRYRAEALQEYQNIIAEFQLLTTKEGVK